MKTLTLRGFKSFASATTFEFEPGVTCVVGPNGSGKSNVVDALSWVMGEQGVKSLRGGKMEDVIFAGTSGRAPLGRAEVSLTIDNTDGALPIDYTEVTISRTLFRSGGSEYAINGSSARLLDVQELLSDSGLGREMHVIVGQGQLDAVLHASPEERRGFIEEAAGVLKHRKRKEKAVRKLEAMQANLTRLSDLTSEIRRQLGPLGRQAKIARRAQTVQADLRDARARLLADDLVQLTSQFEQEAADESALKARRAEVEKALEEAKTRQNHVQRTLAEASPRLAAHRDTWYRLSTLHERLGSLKNLAGERIRLLGTQEEKSGSGRDPDELDKQAESLRDEQSRLAEEIDGLKRALDDAAAHRSESEDAHAREEKRVAALLRASADRREGLARLAGAVQAQRSKVEAAEAEIGRQRESLRETERRRDDASAEFASVEQSVAGVEEGEEGLDREHESAQTELDAAEAALAELDATTRELETEQNSLTARLDALQIGLARQDGSGVLLDSGSPGVLGSVTSLLSVKSGYENAVTAALGRVADAVVVDSVDSAVDAVRYLKDGEAGRSELVIANGADGPAPAPAHDGGTPAIDVVTPKPALKSAIARLLAGTVIVDGIAEARELVARSGDVTAVTRDGDVFSASRALGGTVGESPSLLALQTAVDEAGARQSEIEHELERVRFARAGADERVQKASADVDAAMAELHASDARLAAVAEQLGRLGSQTRSAAAEAERLEKQVATTEESLETERKKLADVTERLAAAEDADEGDQEPDTDARDDLADKARMARAAEMDAKLALRTGEERAHALAGRVKSLEAAARTERNARAEAARRAEIRQQQSQRAQAVASAADAVAEALSGSMTRAAEARDEAEREHAAGEETLGKLRTTVDELQGELNELTDTVHSGEVARTQQRLQIEALQSRAVDELGITAEHLVDEFGPDRPVPVASPGNDSADGGPEGGNERDDGPGAGNERDTVPYVRAEQEKRLKSAERDLNKLGRVNPLALEEFNALEERHKFLETQLDDLKRSRGDLLDIVSDVDKRVEEVFTEAFHDTAEQFTVVFDRLFPGGEGKLVLTNPDDMLTTGIDVEARPAGKKVKRLSLLSGGERSLTAVALLVAIFKARPSPFYVMDEVEAALDDTNLSRLITIFDELRESSQLIVITHQKRTMEVADALYGVSMRGDGVSAVISQRLDGRHDAAAGQETVSES
nr:chromosome segregation protein SMC [Spelaeicoccus albus]